MKFEGKTFFIVAGVLIVLVIGAGLLLRQNDLKGGADMDTTTNTNSTNTPVPQVTESSSLKVEDLTVGTGAEAVAGKKVTVNYVGTLTDGTKFDSSYDRNQPFSFVLGSGQVIAGWDQGVAGMKIGGKRRLTIPPELGYGSQATGSIPANSTLVFEVELLGVE